MHFWLFEIGFMHILIQKNSQDKNIEPSNVNIHCWPNQIRRASTLHLYLLLKPFFLLSEASNIRNAKLTNTIHCHVHIKKTKYCVNLPVSHWRWLPKLNRCNQVMQILLWQLWNLFRLSIMVLKYSHNGYMFIFHDLSHQPPKNKQSTTKS